VGTGGDETPFAGKKGGGGRKIDTILGGKSVYLDKRGDGRNQPMCAFAQGRAGPRNVALHCIALQESEDHLLLFIIPIHQYGSSQAISVRAFLTVLFHGLSVIKHCDSIVLVSRSDRVRLVDASIESQSVLFMRSFLPARR
jgi:hypothetical protein